MNVTVNNKHAAQAQRSEDESLIEAAAARQGKADFGEIGTLGVNAFSNVIQQAYIAELRWPHVWPIYSKLMRSDPEVAVMRFIMGSIATQVQFDVALPDEPTDDDLRYRDFMQEVFDDLEGSSTFIEKMATRVPLLGFAWWEVLPGMRVDGWQAPGASDEWESDYDDGLVGIRRFAFRDHGSFNGWAMDEKAGRMKGFIQQDPPNEEVTIPKGRSLHLTFGDGDNPEGLPVLEAMYRLERYKYGLELVQGIGFEHTAGHLSVEAEEMPDDQAITEIKKAARAILTAQEGNYALWPKGYKASLLESPFQAAAALQEAIRYYGLLKLQLMNLQFVSIATTSGAGSYSAISDSSEMFIVVFNAMLSGLAEQFDEQVGRRLYRWNKDKFPNVSKRPRTIFTNARKFVDLAKLGDFMTKYASLFPMGEQDVINIRQHTGVLSGALPEEDVAKEPPAPVAAVPPEDTPEPDHVPTDDLDDEPEDEGELSMPGVMAQFRAWAKENAAPVYRLLTLRANDDE